jgi:FtsP/CotA-like multicopper oxidase with cupredoxin domain
VTQALRRRDLLKCGALTGVAVTLPLCGGTRAAAASSPTVPLPIVSFQRPLTVPPVARPVRSTGDTDFYQITQRQADVEIIPGTRTRVWGYDGIFPGPTIKARAGRRVLVEQRNDLTVRTSVHRHGGNHPATDDGHPTDLIEPRSSKTYNYPNAQAEIVIDFSQYQSGTQVILRNVAGEDPLTQTVMRFDVVRAEPDESRIPDTLCPLPPPDKPAAERDFVMQLDLATLQFTINGKTFDPERVDVRPRLGSSEIWRIHNADTLLSIDHSFHTHLARFRVLDRNGKPPGPGESGLKDTVLVRPGETVRILPRFIDFPGRFVYHCHFLGHAHSMMATMDVVR